MTELQQNRYDALLRRVGDLKGPGSKVNDVLQELFPTLDVENVPGELLFLMGTRIGWGAAAKTPTAGKKAGIQLFNPAGTGQLVTVSQVLVGGGSTQLISFGDVSTALATNTGVARLRDSRIGTNTDGVSQLRTSPDAVGLVSGQVRVPGGNTFALIDGNSVTVLAPGTGMSVISQTDKDLTVTFFYRERVAEPSELLF